jgi:hypothetical protein
MRPKKYTNTIPLKFGQKSSVLRNPHPAEGFILSALSLTLFLLLAGYVTLVSMSIVNVIARKEALDRVTSLRSTVSELEHQYFTLAEQVTAERGDELGLVKVSDTHYVKELGAVGMADDKRAQTDL